MIEVFSFAFFPLLAGDVLMRNYADLGMHVYMFGQFSSTTRHLDAELLPPASLLRILYALSASHHDD